MKPRSHALPGKALLRLCLILGGGGPCPEALRQSLETSDFPLIRNEPVFCFENHFALCCQILISCHINKLLISTIFTE